MSTATQTTVTAHNPGCPEVFGTLIKVENNMAYVRWITGAGREVVGRFTQWVAA